MAMIDMKKYAKHLSRMLYSNQNGAILIWLILMMVAASIFGLSMVYLTSSATWGKFFANSRMRAYYVAESGGRYAIPLVSADVRNRTTTNMNLINIQEEYTLDNDKFLLEIVDNRPSIPSPSIPSFILIHSTGNINVGSAKITYRLNISRAPFQQAVYGREVTLNNNAVTDSYDSSDGVYGGSNVGSNGDVTTEADSISLGNNAVINGDQETNASIDFPSVCLPAGGTPPLSDYNPTEDEDLPAGTYWVSQVELDNNVQLTILGEVVLIVEQDFTLSNNSSIVLSEDDTLTIYVAGDILFDNVSNINEGTAPENLIIYGACSTDCTSCTGNIELTNVSTINAVIYAPDYSIILDNNSQLFGALIGDQVLLKSNATVHFDDALKTLEFDNIPPHVGSIIQYFQY